MIDRKLLEKSNIEMNTRQNDINETSYKDPISSNKHSLHNKLYENIKNNSVEHSLINPNNKSSDAINKNQMLFRNQLKIINNLNEENSKTNNNGNKYEILRPNNTEISEGNRDIHENFFKFNYFALPKYGLEEKSTQTDYTSRELDNMKYIADEFHSLKDEFLLNFISNHPDLIKKIYKNAIRKKNAPTRINVNIKRRINSKIHEKSKKSNMDNSFKIDKRLKKSSYLEKNVLESNINIKSGLNDSIKRSSSDTVLNKVSNVKNLIKVQNNNINLASNLNGTKESSTSVSENFLSKKHLMDNLIDSMDKTNKEEYIDKSESQSGTPSISLKKDLSYDKFLKKQLSIEKKNKNIQKKKKFDPFNFFKEEYIHSHPYKDHSIIEQVKYK